eukprot:400595_1
MRLNHSKYKFGPYDEQDDKYNQSIQQQQTQSSPSKLSTTSTSNASTVNSNASSPKEIIMDQINDIPQQYIHNGFIQSNQKNVGKDLISILNSCKIHPRNTNKNGIKPIHKNGLSNNNNNNNNNNNDYIIEMNGEYPILFPLCYA